MFWAYRLLGLLGFAAALLIAGCATPISATSIQYAQDAVWNGRMAINVENQPSQSFSTNFELKGSAQLGELSLFSPLGSTIAQLTWNAERASLRTPNEQRDYASLDDLMVQATGTAIPVAALFDWLKGINTPVAGWQVELAQPTEGRITAKRADPATVLRVVLER